MSAREVAAKKVMTALDSMWTTQGIVLGKLHARDQLLDMFAEVWDQGQRSGRRFESRQNTADDLGHPEFNGPPSANPFRAFRSDREEQGTHE